MAKEKCSCGTGSFSWLILSAVFFAVGLYFVVMGVQYQWGGADWWSAMLWYAIGGLLMLFGKMCKWKSHSSCPVHCMAK